eukprot:1491596-Rhodomonas_salina.6
MEVDLRWVPEESDANLSEAARLFAAQFTRTISFNDAEIRRRSDEQAKRHRHGQTLTAEAHGQPVLQNANRMSCCSGNDDGAVASLYSKAPHVQRQRASTTWAFRPEDRYDSDRIHLLFLGQCLERKPVVLTPHSAGEPSCNLRDLKCDLCARHSALHLPDPIPYIKPPFLESNPHYALAEGSGLM